MAPGRHHSARPGCPLRVIAISPGDELDEDPVLVVEPA